MSIKFCILCGKARKQNSLKFGKFFNLDFILREGDKVYKGKQRYTNDHEMSLTMYTKVLIKNVGS